MTAFRNFSIRSKFLLAVLVTVFTALLIALSSITTLSNTLASNDFRDQLRVLVDVTADRSSAALAFRDKRAITQNLNTLSNLKSIDLACVYTEDGKLFANYERDDAWKTCDKKFDLASNREEEGVYKLVSHLSARDKDYGFLYVEANSSSLDQRLIKFLLYSGLIILFSLFVAYLLALRLQKNLTLPIIKLSRLSELIAQTRDFSLRAKVFNKDEAGTLAKSFNGLISDIQDNQMQMEEMVVELREKSDQLESHTEIVEERNKSIKTMFAGASHDLKQPLQAMTLFVNALNEISNPAQRELVSKLDMAIQNMRSLFDDLLDVSKIESRLDHIETEAVKIKPLLDSVFHEFDAMAEDKNLKLQFHAKDFVVKSNSRMLERIVRNLLSNAIRYTTKGGVLLACRKREGSICIEIWDTGRGIPEESMASIFKSFYQVERKSVEGQQGYGLGLSIVKRLSELLEHPIEIKSKFGRGTMFRVVVPIYSNEQIAPATIDQQHAEKEEFTHVAVPKITSLPGDHTRVLLIDDDDLVRDSLVALLQSWRMDVVAFDSIASMSAFLGDNTDVRFDVIVSDFQLSETETGLDAIDLAKDKLGDHMPALIVTGTTDEELLAQIKESGIRKLSKPVKPAKLRALINHLCAESVKPD